MKKRIYWVIVTLLTLHCSLFTSEVANAQPAARRSQQQAAAASQSNANNMTTRAQISFPTAVQMSEDVVWRRDIYRELDLTNSSNSGLYYPEEPSGDQMNLFTYIFKLMLSGKIKVYEYRLDGNESFTDSARLKPLDILDRYGIYYERNGKSVHIDNSDIPSREVKNYYIKESAYYDQANATFHKKVVALCPVMKREDDFGDIATPYPLFWVKYDDLAPFLAKQTLMTSDLNNAATMSAEDFFTKNMYKGNIYKTNNMLGQTLIQVVGGDETKLSAEQKRIEDEIAAFEKNLYGNQELKDSLDSVNVNNKSTKDSKKKTKTEKKKSSETKQKTHSEKKSSSSSSSARVSVRRERH